MFRILPSHIRLYYKTAILAIAIFLTNKATVRAQLTYDVNIKTYPCHYLPHIANETVKKIEIDYPHFVKAIAITPDIDTIILVINVFVPEQVLSDSLELLYSMAMSNAQKLMSFRMLPHVTFYSKFFFHNKIGGIPGNYCVWTFNHDNPSDIESDYVPYQGLEINEPSFWIRSKQLQLAHNQVIYLLPDSTLCLVSFVPDSTFFPNHTTQIYQSKELVRIIYELTGPQTKCFKRISEHFIDRYMNSMEKAAINVSDMGLIEDPNRLLAWYRRFFPYGVPYCGQCD